MSNINNIIMEENIALTHTDERRTIYEPNKLLEGLSGEWYPHNIITIKANGLYLANHHHDYNEVFFTPTGGFKWAFADEGGNTRLYEMNEGSRLLIPEGVDHLVVGSKGAVLMGYGSVEFDPKRLITASDENKRLMRETLGDRL